MSFIVCIQILLLSYALGSVPFGVVFAKLFGLPDPRTIGSGNIGATNMLRTGNKKVALLTLLFDAGKGAAAVLLTYHLFRTPLVAGCETLAECPTAIDNPHYGALAALVAAVGHMYSPWLKFKGGKGMATVLGASLAFSWPVGMAALILWVLTCYTTRFVSVASIVALATVPLVTWLRIDSTSAFILAIAAGIAIWRHKDNIKRLHQGFEPRIKFKADRA